MKYYAKQSSALTFGWPLHKPWRVSGFFVLFCLFVCLFVCFNLHAHLPFAFCSQSIGSDDCRFLMILETESIAPEPVAVTC